MGNMVETNRRSGWGRKFASQADVSPGLSVTSESACLLGLGCWSA